MDEGRFKKWPLEVVVSVMYGRIMGDVHYTELHNFLNFMTSHNLKQRQLPTAMRMSARMLERQFPILSAATQQWSVRDDDKGHAICSELKKEFKDDLNVYAPKAYSADDIDFSSYEDTIEWKNHLKPFI
jgi:hypothetical protein